MGRRKSSSKQKNNNKNKSVIDMRSSIDRSERWDEGSSISHGSVGTIRDPEVLKDYLDNQIEIIDLELAEKQLKVLTQHIEKLRQKKTNETVITVPSSSQACKVLDEMRESNEVDNLSDSKEVEGVEEMGDIQKEQGTWRSFFPKDQQYGEERYPTELCASCDT